MGRMGRMGRMGLMGLMGQMGLMEPIRPNCPIRHICFIFTEVTSYSVASAEGVSPNATFASSGESTGW